MNRKYFKSDKLYAKYLGLDVAAKVTLLSQLIVTSVGDENTELRAAAEKEINGLGLSSEEKAECLNKVFKGMPGFGGIEVI